MYILVCIVFLIAIMKNNITSKTESRMQFSTMKLNAVKLPMESFAPEIEVSLANQSQGGVKMAKQQPKPKGPKPPNWPSRKPGKPSGPRRDQNPPKTK